MTKEYKESLKEYVGQFNNDAEETITTEEYTDGQTTIGSATKKMEITNK